MALALARLLHFMVKTVVEFPLAIPSRRRLLPRRR
jgi:hypothetical protein